MRGIEFKLDHYLRRQLNALKEKDGAWGYYESSIDDYKESFTPLGLGNAIHLLGELHRQKDTYALDIMGAGQAIRDLKERKVITAGVSMTLTDLRSEEKKASDDEQQLQVIDGDILTNQPWSKVQDWLKHKQIPGFDLIVCRPQAGLENLPPFPRYHEALFWKAFNLLSLNGGQLFTQVPECNFRQDYHEEKVSWIHQINRLPGVHAISVLCSEYPAYGYLPLDLINVRRTPESAEMSYNRHSVRNHAVTSSA